MASLAAWHEVLHRIVSVVAVYVIDLGSRRTVALDAVLTYRALL